MSLLLLLTSSPPGIGAGELREQVQNGRTMYSSGRPVFGSPGDPCCCEEGVWYSLLPCDVVIDPSICLNYSTHCDDETDCFWITGDRWDDLVAEAIAAGDVLGPFGCSDNYLIVSMDGVCYRVLSPMHSGCNWLCSTTTEPTNIVDADITYQGDGGCPVDCSGLP